MKQNLYKYIVVILGFYAFWLVGLPFIFSQTVPQICRKISVTSDYEINVTKPSLRLSVLPKVTLKSTEISVKKKNSEDAVLLKDFNLSFRLLPILSGRFHINNISASDLRLNAILGKDVELNKDLLNRLNGSHIKCDRVKLDKFNVSLFVAKANQPIVYSGENIYYKQNRRYLKLNIDSQIDVQGSASSVLVSLYLPKDNDVKKSLADVKITNLDIAPIADYLKQYLPADLLEVKGIIDVNVDKYNLDATLKNCKVLMKDEAKSIIFPDVLKINSDFNLTSKKINFDYININSKNIDAVVKGSVSNYLDKTLTDVDLNVQLNKSRVEDLVNLLPPIVVEEFNVYKLKKYKFYGDTIGNITIKGDVIEPDVMGDVFIENGILIEPIKNAKGATIKLDFTGRYINFDVFVPAGGAEKVWVKGGVELYNVKYSDMHIWSTKQVDLKTAENKVVPLHEILNFVIGPVPIMDVNGDGNIDIIVKGNRKNPNVWGVLNVNNVTTFFKEIPDLVLKNASAVLTFDDQNAVFTTQKGLINGTQASINGVCNLYGKFDFDVESKSQELGYLYNAIKTSTMIEEIKNMLPDLDVCKGLINLTLKVYGEVKDIEDLKFNQNFFTGGELEFLGDTFGMQGISVQNTKGKLLLDKTEANADITSFVGGSKLSAKAVVKNDTANVSVDIPKLNLNDITPNKNDLQKEMGNILLNVKAGYKGNIKEVEYDKVNFVADILGTTPENKLKLSNGRISLKHNKLSVSNLHGAFGDAAGNFDVNLNADNVSEKPNINGNIKLTNFALSNITGLTSYSIIPTDVREMFKLVKFDKGKINLNCRINHSKINFYTDLGGVAFRYVPLDLPIKIINGSLIMHNNNLRLNKINLLADGMPVLADGVVNDIFAKQNFDMYFNSKPKQDFIDKYINKNQIYPIKIKGDIVYSAKVKGIKDNFDLKADVNMAKDSSIYHLGATVGDVENAIVLNLDSKILHQNNLKIREFSYDKIIPSQGSRQTRLNMLKARGGIEVFKDDLAFDNLVIKTQNPTDARIFNIIFRKPNIKQGQFTSDLRFNGRLSNPRLLGNFHIFETNIPFLDTTMKNITFVFKDKNIELSSIGEVLGNDIRIQAVIINKLTQPYYVERAVLNTKLLDLNHITNKLKLSQVDNMHTFESFEGLDFSSLVIKNIKMNADSIHLRNIVADNFEATASFNEKKVMNVNRFKFDIANGTLDGNFTYNMMNNYTGLKLNAKQIDANDLSIALFDLPNQIYGDLTGETKLSCDGSNFETCMKTLNGKTSFDVINGRMPKLGSLEYLLKAGNLVKGGITNISINSVIDIITPLKTGNFSDIYGNIKISDGVADDIEISTKGKDLSLYLTGTYNFSSSNAEMEVLGLLSKKISTMFGPIGNLSLNTLFNSIPGVDLSKNSPILSKINRIPGIEISGKTYRKFIAEIKGNINGDNYVTSFKWIN